VPLEPRQRPIQEARVAEPVPKASGGGATDTALATRAGPVQRHDKATPERRRWLGIHRGQDSGRPSGSAVGTDRAPGSLGRGPLSRWGITPGKIFDERQNNF